jgi:hypothetical protein
VSAGFLERLAQRAQGKESGIRPVLPPLFAPETPGLGLPVIEERNQAAQSAAPEAESTMRKETAPPPPATPSPSASGVPSVHPLMEQSIPSSPRGSVMPPEAHHLHDPARLSTPREDRAPQPPTAPPAEPPAAEDRLLPQRMPPAQDEALPPLRPAPPAPAAAPLESEALLLPPQTPPVLLIQPVDAKESSMGAAPEKALPPAPPAVHVSIGRIEVRAVRATPLSQTPPPDPHPSMTLDEYLRRLNEGDR